MWFYSSANGYVYRTDKFVAKHIVEKFSHEQQNPDELVGLLKKPHF